MRTITFYIIYIVLALAVNQLRGQEDYQKKVEILKEQKAKITQQEKDALRFEIEDILDRLEKGNISQEQADDLKMKAAEKRALNIENRVAIVENKINLLERNKGLLLVDISADTITQGQFRIGVDINGKAAQKVIFNSKDWKRDLKYDRRTYSDFVFAIGLNNTIVEGQSLNNSPYKIGGSRFFEMGWQWRTRVFKNTNFLRFNYGFSFQFNGLKPKDNQYFVALDNGQTELQEFNFELKKSKLRMDNLVFPLHLEFGPSKLKKTEEKIRYSLRNQFRIGVGGYAGFNLGTRQKLKYDRNGDNVKDKLRRGYNTNELVYGLSAYAGVDGVLLYVKYDLNPVFKDALVPQRNVSLGLRFDL